MDAHERESLAREVDLLAAALDDERARHQAGLEPEPALTRLFEAHPAAAHRETAARLRADGAAGLAGRVAALAAEWLASPHEEAWRAAEAAAVVAGPDGPLSLPDADRALAREDDRSRRQALADAAAAALEGPARHREAWAETRARGRATVGLFPDWAVVVEGDQALGACDDAWRDLVEFAARHDPALAAASRGGLARHDLLRLLAFPSLDGLLGRGALTEAVRATTRDLGLDLDGVRLDEVDRPGAWPGVHPLGARITVRAAGGLPDWPALLDALGRAVAAVPHPASGRDALLGPALGRALAGLCLEPRWLADRLELSRRQLPDLVRAFGLRELLGLRAAAAALRVATEVERGLAGQAWREAHRDGLTAALHATWDGVRASRDADAGPLAATVRGFAEGERLRRWLRERFDEDWWRNPRAREYLAALLAAGKLPEGEPASASERAGALALALERGGAT